MTEEPSKAVTVTVTPTPPIKMPATFTASDMALVANELAMQVFEEADIAAHYNLNADQFKLLKENGVFKTIYETAVAEWAKVTSAQKRLSLEAAILTERVLPKIGARLTKETEPLQNVVQGLKVLSDMAGMGGEKNATQNTDRVTITINLGEDTLKTVVGTVTAETIQVHPERVGDGGPVPLQLEGPRKE